MVEEESVDVNDFDIKMQDDWKLMDLSKFSDRTKTQIIKLEKELSNVDNTRK